MHSFMDAKLMAKLLRQGLAERQIELSHSDCLELVASQLGVANWNILSARIEAASADMAPLVMPEGWSDGSVNREGYFRMGLDPERPGCAMIQSTPLADYQLQAQFGTMAQVISAEPYRGGAIRVACELSARALEGTGTIWLRVDDRSGRVLQFENLMQRPGVAVRNTEDWKGFAITLDVPEAAEGIYFGFMMHGRGTLWARNFSVDAVEARDQPEQRRPHRFERPTNLGFGA